MGKVNSPYSIDVINAAMGAQRLSNERLAKKAGVGTMTVSKIRNGDTQVGYVTLKRVVEALGITMTEVADTEGKLVEKTK